MDGVVTWSDLEVLIIDNLSHYLLAILCFNYGRYWTSFGENKCFLEIDNTVLAVGDLEWNLFTLAVRLVELPEVSFMTSD